MDGMVDELLDLLEAAFHDGLIDGEQLSLASAYRVRRANFPVKYGLMMSDIGTSILAYERR